MTRRSGGRRAWGDRADSRRAFWTGDWLKRVANINPILNPRPPFSRLAPVNRWYGVRRAACTWGRCQCVCRFR